MQQDGCQGAEPVAGGWLDAKPSCIAGGFAALQQKKRDISKCSCISGLFSLTRAAGCCKRRAVPRLHRVSL